MSFPAKCPVCGTLLEFPVPSPYDPVRCPSCDSRFKLEGRQVAHLIFTDYYELLGLNPGAPEGELGKAIRAKILEHHPDRNPNDPTATEKLRVIIEAKELLADPEKREVYNSVYFAKSLVRWAHAKPGYQAPKTSYTMPGAQDEKPYSGYTSRQPPPPPGGTEYQNRENAPSGGRYEEMTRNARTRSRQASAEDVEHLIEEIEIIFMQAGVPMNLTGKNRASQKSNETLWRILGTISFVLAGGFYGLLNGSIPGMFILMLLGGLAGWILTSYPGGLVVLSFLVARIFVFGFILGLVAAHTATGSWFPSNINALFTVISSGPILGAVAFGLWGLTTSWLNPRSPYIVRHVIHRQAVTGAWVGALWAVLLASTRSYYDSSLSVTFGWWILFFTIYLFLDVKIFGRSWIIVRERM